MYAFLEHRHFVCVGAISVSICPGITVIMAAQRLRSSPTLSTRTPPTSRSTGSLMSPCRCVTATKLDVLLCARALTSLFQHAWSILAPSATGVPEARAMTASECEPVQVDLDKLGRTQFMVQHQDGKFGHFAVEVCALCGRSAGVPTGSMLPAPPSIPSSTGTYPA